MGVHADRIRRENEERKAQIAPLLQQGLSNKKVREIVGRDRAYLVTEVRRELGLAGPDKGKDAIRQRNARIVQMARDGYTSRQIAAEVGVKPGHCRNVLKRHGVEVPGDVAVGHTRRHDPTRIVECIVRDAQNLTAGVELVDVARLDPDRVPDYHHALQAACGRLGELIRKLGRLMKEQSPYVPPTNSQAV
jgi:transposase